MLTVHNEFTELLNRFEVIHPDGIGVYFASHFLFGNRGLKKRFSGSDFYDELIRYCTEQKRSLFFFGHDDKTLSRIRSKYPELVIAGLQNGYQYNDDEVISTINNSGTHILICGLGMPRQEEWIIRNRGKLECKVMLCVGEGIKVFSGTKLRGPVLFRKLGLEWFIRFLSNPLRYFTRYVIGNPLFLYRIIALKMRNLRR